MSKRSPYKKGDVITTNQMREIHSRNKHLPRGPFKVTQVIKTGHNKGGYRIIADAAKKGVCVSWVMFYSLTTGPRGGRTEYAFHGPISVIDPTAQEDNRNKADKVVRRAKKRAAARPAAPSLSKVIPAGTKRTKVLLTLSQFDGDDL